jgi:ATP/maltotriose-dependent transcriptional regulator MalT
MEEQVYTKGEVMDLTTVCHSFPRLPERMISRDNIIDVLERMFDGGIELVSVEGEDGLGKTTLLAQFAKCHPHNTFSVFIRPPAD